MRSVTVKPSLRSSPATKADVFSSRCESSGAACSSTDPGPSHVLLALGLSEDLARSTLRFGLGRFNTVKDVDFAAKTVADAVERLRGLR